MPPRFIPPYSENHDFHGEALVYRYLHETLPDTATVFTHVRIPDYSNGNHNPKYRREADAIIILPQGVLVVVEVKGGRLKPVTIKMGDGSSEEWMASLSQLDDGESPYRLEHPSRQADTLRGDLRTHLKTVLSDEVHGDLARLKIWAVSALPHTSEEDRPKNKKYNRFVYCGEACKRLGASLNENAAKEENDFQNQDWWKCVFDGMQKLTL